MTEPTNNAANAATAIGQEILEGVGFKQALPGDDLREKIASLPQEKKDHLRKILDRDHDGFLDAKETALVVNAALGRSIWKTSDNNRTLGQSNGQLEDLHQTSLDPTQNITPKQAGELHAALGEAFGGYGHYESLDKHDAARLAQAWNLNLLRQVSAAVQFDRDFGVVVASASEDPTGNLVPLAKDLANKTKEPSR